MKKPVFILFLICAVAILSERGLGDIAKRGAAEDRSGPERAVDGPTPSLINFSDNFDSYTAGVQLVVQNPTDWELWSGGSGGTEDPYVSSAQAFSGSNSVVIVLNNDLVKTYGALTTGMWKMSWQMYIPVGKAGYFNTLADFAGATSNWAMQVFLNAGGDGTLDAGGQSAASFNYTQGAWILCEVICDLDNDLGEFILEGASVYTWQWTLGTFGDGSPLQLDATDFYGFTASDEMYVDDFEIIPLACQDFTNFVTRCTNTGMLQARVVLLNNTSHAGELVEFLVEEDSYTATIVTNGVSSRAQISLPGFAAGTYTVSVTSPAECFDPRPVTCTASDRQSAEWEADDARWEAEIQQLEARVAPTATKLVGNYPNPSNPSTAIRYELSQESQVTLRIYDMLGQLVKTLVDGVEPAGNREVVWDGRNEYGSVAASGVYLYRMTAGGFTDTRRILLLK